MHDFGIHFFSPLYYNNIMSKLTKVKEQIWETIFRNKGFAFFYNIGIDFYNKKDYANAILNFKLALEQKNIKPQVYYNLALTYQSIKNYDRAIVTYHKFLERNPKDYDGLYNLALTYQMNENHFKATEFFEKCMEIKKEADGVRALTLAYLEQNEMQKAIDFAEDIFKSDSNGTNLYYVIAKIFESKNPFGKDFTYIDKAIEMYLKITEKDSKYFDAYLAISICYAKKGELGKSVDYCQKALEVNSESYEANNQMGLVYYCCEEVSEAVKYYERALQLNPDEDYKIYSNLGYAYEKIGEVPKATSIFKQLITKFPDSPAVEEVRKHLKVLRTM